jgi:general secretion pathway protein M
MTATDSIKQHLTRSPLIAGTAYIALMTLLAAIAWGAIADVLEHRSTLVAAQDTLAQIEQRKATSFIPPDNDTIVPAGSAFLEGPTVTVAAAALLQRVAAAVTKAGGTIQSSQVELQGPQSRTDFIGVIASCEIDQPALQELLYDLESGMPFLFVEQLAVQAPIPSTGAREGRLRVQLAVYGQWQGEK